MKQSDWREVNRARSFWLFHSLIGFGLIVLTVVGALGLRIHYIDAGHSPTTFLAAHWVAAPLPAIFVVLGCLRIISGSVGCYGLYRYFIYSRTIEFPPDIVWRIGVPGLFRFLCARNLERLENSMWRRYKNERENKKSLKQGKDRLAEAERLIAKSYAADTQLLYFATRFERGSPEFREIQRVLNKGSLSEKRALIQRFGSSYAPPQSQKFPKGPRREAPPRVEPAPPEAEPVRTLAESRTTCLSEVESELGVARFLPESVDKIMAASIILEILDLGNRKTAFGESYRAEDTLKRMVVRRYARSKSQFDPRSFSRTLRWLRKEGILCSKNKTDEEVFSLSPKPSSASNRESSELIREVVRFYNSVSSPS